MSVEIKEIIKNVYQVSINTVNPDILPLVLRAEEAAAEAEASKEYVESKAGEIDTAYDHSQETGNPHNTQIEDIPGLAEAIEQAGQVKTVNGINPDSNGNIELELLELGEDSDTAFDGERGKIAYEHSQETGNPHETTFAEIGSKPSLLSGYGITDAYDKTETDGLLAVKIEINGDLGGMPTDVLVSKIRNAALVGQTTLVAVLPDGTVQAQEQMEFEVIDDTISGYASLAAVVAAYPASSGYDIGLQVICPFMSSPTIYKKVGEGDSYWLRMAGGTFELMS